MAASSRGEPGESSHELPSGATIKRAFLMYPPHCDLWGRGYEVEAVAACHAAHAAGGVPAWPSQVPKTLGTLTVLKCLLRMCAFSNDEVLRSGTALALSKLLLALAQESDDEAQFLARHLRNGLRTHFPSVLYDAMAYAQDHVLDWVLEAAEGLQGLRAAVVNFDGALLPTLGLAVSRAGDAATAVRTVACGRKVLDSLSAHPALQAQGWHEGCVALVAVDFQAALGEWLDLGRALGVPHLGCKAAISFPPLSATWAKGHRLVPVEVAVLMDSPDALQAWLGRLERLKEGQPEAVLNSLRVGLRRAVEGAGSRKHAKSCADLILAALAPEAATRAALECLVDCLTSGSWKQVELLVQAHERGAVAFSSIDLCGVLRKCRDRAPAPGFARASWWPLLRLTGPAFVPACMAAELPFAAPKIAQQSKAAIHLGQVMAWAAREASIWPLAAALGDAGALARSGCPPSIRGTPWHRLQGSDWGHGQAFTSMPPWMVLDTAKTIASVAGSGSLRRQHRAALYACMLGLMRQHGDRHTELVCRAFSGLPLQAPEDSSGAESRSAVPAASSEGEAGSAISSTPDAHASATDHALGKRAACRLLHDAHWSLRRPFLLWRRHQQLLRG